jgi:hypothetical protein
VRRRVLPIAGTSQRRAGRCREMAVAVSAEEQAKADGCGMGVAAVSQYEARSPLMFIHTLQDNINVHCHGTNAHVDLEVSLVASIRIRLTDPI